MRFLRLFLLTAGIYAQCYHCEAQYFSETLEKFKSEAVTLIRSYDSEATYQASNKFVESWNNGLKTPHKKQIIEIANRMVQKKHKRDAFFNFFVAMAFATEIEHLSDVKITKLLKMTENIIKTRRFSEFTDYLLGLNYFFARRYLSFTPNLQIQALGGAYSFKMIGMDSEEFFSDSGYETDSLQNPNASEVQEEDPWADQDFNWDDYQNDVYDNSAWDNDTYDQNTAGGYNDYNDTPMPIRPDVQLPMVENVVEKIKANYLLFQEEGPAISLSQINLFIKSQKDTFSIQKVRGNYLLKNRVFSAKGGEINWPQKFEKMKGANITLDLWYFDAKKESFWTPNAKLSNSSFSKEPIEGKFSYSVQNNKDSEPQNFRFMSHDAHLTLALSDSITYTGGLEVRGNHFYGQSTSEELGRLEILGKNNTKIIIQSSFFDLDEAQISTKNASLTVIHNQNDSLFHPNVRVKYDLAKQKLDAFVNKTAKTNALVSSYFQLNIYIDRFTFYVQEGNMVLNVFEGKNIIPIIIESADYFNPERMRRLNPLFKIHPIALVVNFANKYGVKTFYDLELAQEYDLTIETVRSELKILTDYDFITYDPKKWEVTVKEKAFKYYDATLGKYDFDNLYLEAVSEDKANGIIQLDSGHFIVNGVKSMTLTKGYSVEIIPDSLNQIIFLENRGVHYNGSLKEEEVIYKGSDFTFNYEEFKVEMNKIDTLNFIIKNTDSLATDSLLENTPYEINKNAVISAGILHVESPNNKSGRESTNIYPYFTSKGQHSILYLGPQMDDPQYTRSVFFMIPTIAEDTSQQINPSSLPFELEGTFYSDGIFHPFEETLFLQQDKMLGFKHAIKKGGYHLYNKQDALAFDNIQINKKGIKGSGKVKIRTVSLQSESYTYFPDSMTTDRAKGQINGGDYKNISYPQIALDDVSVVWDPNAEKMRIIPIQGSLSLYKDTYQLNGNLLVKEQGIWANGELKTHNFYALALGDDFHFKEAISKGTDVRFTGFESSIDKPVIEGKDVFFQHDIDSNWVSISQNNAFVGNVTFPEMNIVSTLKHMEWDIDSSLITLTKSESDLMDNAYIKSKNSESTLPKIFIKNAKYYVNKNEMHLEDIPFIMVGDAKIIPEGKSMTLVGKTQNFELKNVNFSLDTLSNFHHFIKGNINIFSDTQFDGKASYLHIVNQDTFEILCHSFDFIEVKMQDKRKQKMTIAKGKISEEETFKFSEGFHFKGDVTLYASIENLAWEGFLNLDVQNLDRQDAWIPFQSLPQDSEVSIPLPERFSNDMLISSGIHFDLKGNLQATFLQPLPPTATTDFFEAKGYVYYDKQDKTHRVSNQATSQTDVEWEKTEMTYHDEDQIIRFKGKCNFLQNQDSKFSLQAAAVGQINKKENTYQLEAFMIPNFKIPNQVLDIMSKEIAETIEILGALGANEPTDINMTNIANLIGEIKTQKYLENSSYDYTPLWTADSELEKGLVFSNIKFEWNVEHKAWYSISPIGLSNIGTTDINALLDGFVEIKQNNMGSDEISMFFQAGPDTWYYINYMDESVLLYSANEVFNQSVQELYNSGKQRFNQMLLLEGSKEETLDFINDFRKKYLGIEKPYNLNAPAGAKELNRKKPIKKKEENLGF